MVGFRFKTIDNPLSLGEKLQQTRLNLGINIREVAKATNISAKYLSALEAGDYRSLPGEVYGRSFLKVYAKFLALNTDEFLLAYESEQKIFNNTQKDNGPDFKKPVKRISAVHLIVTPKLIRSILIGFLVVACLVYLGWKIVAILTPPRLLVEEPVSNLVTNQSFVEVAGMVEPESNLEINGTQVLADLQGRFSETVDLQPGVNIIEVVAEKRHGKQTKKYLQVVVN
ncbi:MAG: hypothetical protein A2729_01215 [Candidatus Buchananbacteria bacterium RIFCSPHIGHO2_01_FULL_39_14]|uniref:HTH cro/C1-type domain-containing protein n=2 Tax=Candidatus Buchananiibacteriota TaxID=1817903 RepID=A0A1G1YU55_9BACT|nr:MAG: hypothetical protein A2729_01215 [Candidatus Buchananbacteria bacterium RIFCSPHIGHO2_01_FULL_39_14]OGY49158.1 MAG: hypothetical protein A3D39_05625 [Candidatus Buchananbacteria bacterium RIFCSPHIGHO2_02_FULL_39_17]OGY55891.1 MAG: hypothetical protein A2912_02805 [Candidatus Buchananbacteria bacterium RIFCSPLOWO2_01_FULL_40_23b]